MHVAEILFYNMYVPPDIRGIVDEYYTVQQKQFNSTYKASIKPSSEIRRDILLNYLINEDIQVSANSSYMNLSEFFDMGTIASMTDKVVATEGGFRGEIAEKHSNFRNIFNYSLWEKTEPINIHFKITLYSKTDPLLDVMIPAYMIMSHAGLDKLYPENGSYNSDIIYAVPGISFGVAMDMYNKSKINLESQQTNAINSSSGDKNDKIIVKHSDLIDYANKQNNTKSTKLNKIKSIPEKNSSSSSSSSSSSDIKVYNSKLLSCLIKGLVYIDMGMMKSITATFSKHTAKTSLKTGNNNNSILQGDFPIWAELDVQIESSKPAVSYMLWDSLQDIDIWQRGMDSQFNFGLG